MGQEYSDPKRARDEHALPDIEVFELTALECAERDEDLIHEYSKRHEFRLCHVNGKVREAMLDAIVEEQGIKGGWFWWSCFPGCLPDGEANGPFKTYKEALADAQENSDQEAE